MDTSEKIYHELRTQIINGEYTPGDYLPSENELSRMYSFSRSTIRKILEKLSYEGYIKKEKGRGSRVMHLDHVLHDIEFKKNLDNDTGKSKNYTLISLQNPVEISWPKKFYYSLGPEESTKGCSFFNRLYLIDIHVVMTDYFYIPLHKVKGLVKQPLINNSIFETLDKIYKIKIINRRSDLSAIYANLRISSILNTFPGAPLIRSNTIYTTNVEGLNIYSTFYYNTGDYLFSENIRIL